MLRLLASGSYVGRNHRLHPSGGPATVDPHPATAQSAPPYVLELPYESILVRTTSGGLDTPCDGMTRLP